MSCLRNESHSLQIDTYRHNNVLYPDMLCTLCGTQAIEYEYHFVVQCTCYASLRNEHIPLKYCIPTSHNRLIVLMSSKNESVIKSLATYIYYAFERRKRCLVWFSITYLSFISVYTRYVIPFFSILWSQIDVPKCYLYMQQSL